MNGTDYLPEPGFVAQLLSGTIRRRVSAAKASPLDLRLKTPKTYGVFRDSAAARTCMCVLELPLSAWLAGSFAQFPPPVISDVIRTGRLEEVMIESLHEVLNVSARFFNAHGHQVLQGLYLADSALPKDAAVALASPEARLDLQISITDGGSARMAILVGPHQKLG